MASKSAIGFTCRIIAAEFWRFWSADVSARFTTLGARMSSKNLTMARRLLRATGKPQSLISHVADRPGHDRRYALTCYKIERELGWKPAISLDDGLRQTIEWYRSNTKWLTEVRRGDYRTYYQKYYENRNSSLHAITESGRKPTS
jgi:dTDP-glucose 4,6-dehydratase